MLFLAWAPFFSGAERALVRALQGLASAPYEPFVLVGTDGELAAQLRNIGVPHEITDVRPLDWHEPLRSARSLARVFRTARRHGISIIHANDVPSFQAGGYVADALHLPAITHVRFPDTRQGYEWFLRPTVARAIFVSESQRADAIAEAPHIFAGRSEVLHDCVEAQPEWTPEERARVRAGLGLCPDDTLVAMAGQVSTVKGIWEFVDAARILVSQGSGAQFVVLGDDLKSGGLVRREMEERVRAAGLSHRFTFLGFKPDAARLMQAFDIVTVPSHVEPFGLAALEGSAAGCAVVASGVGGLPEIVTSGETGVLVPPRAPGSLAGAIRHLVDDAVRRRELGTEARRRARANFSIEAYGTRLCELYDRVQGGAATTAAAVKVKPA